MKRIITLIALLLGLTALFAITAAAEDRVAHFYHGETEVDAVVLEGDALTLPDAPDTGNQSFVGWVLHRADGTERLLAAGAAFSDAGGSGNLQFESLAIELRTLPGAAVSTAGADTLRFDGVLELSAYNRLVTLVGTENLTFGMLVAPYVSPAAFTLESCPAGTVNRVSAAFAYSTAQFGVFLGATEPLSADDILTRYCGRAYLTVNLDGTPVTLYASYSLKDHMRNLHGVSAAAYEDRMGVASATYATQIAPASYSRFTAEQIAFLKSRLDKVIYLHIDLNGDALEESRIQSKFSMDHFAFSDFESSHYASPYKVERILTNDPNGYDTYVITAAEGADINNVRAYYVGGSYRTPNRAAEWRADGIYISVLRDVTLP